MLCDVCGDKRLIHISGKSVDLNFVTIPHLKIEHDGYVPEFIGKWGDYIEFTFCAECGYIQGFRPITDQDILRDPYINPR